MKKAGFTFVADGSASTSASTVGRVEPYGLDDLQAAKVYGYQPAVPFSERTKLSQHKKLPAGESGPAFNKALTGYVGAPPTGKNTVKGCQGKAIHELWGGNAPPDPNSVVGELGAQAEQEVEGDAKIISLVNEWSNCMSKAGFPYPNPTVLLNRQWKPAYPARPSSTEIATAIADVTCKTSVGLPLAWYRAESHDQSQLIEAHPTELAAIMTAQDAMLQRAADIVERAKSD